MRVCGARRTHPLQELDQDREGAGGQSGHLGGGAGGRVQVLTQLEGGAREEGGEGEHPAVVLQGVWHREHGPGLPIGGGMEGVDEGGQVRARMRTGQGEGLE